MRLNRYLARAGVASRRGADELIKKGRVTVNGQRGELNTFVAARDVVEVDLAALVDALAPPRSAPTSTPAPKIILVLHVILKDVGVAMTRPQTWDKEYHWIFFGGRIIIWRNF